MLTTMHSQIIKHSLKIVILFFCKRIYHKGFFVSQTMTQEIDDTKI